MNKQKRELEEIMTVNDISCYALVDSGASISLCSKEILGPDVKLDGLLNGANSGQHLS